MTDNEEQLKRMVMTFRVSELQMLLGYAGKNKTGRKSELQSRALDIVRMRNPSIHQKIKELYKSIQLEMMSFGERSQTGGTTGAGIMQNPRVPSAIGSISVNYSQSGNMGVNTNSSYGSRSQSAQVNSVLGSYSSLQQAHNSSYPISPDVRLKKLPFYDILGELLKPSTLAPHGGGRYQEASFSFSLTPQQANKIAHSRDLRPGKQDYAIQVQMRFCLLETTCEQEDNFPPNITVKINDKMCPLPSPIPTNKQGVEPKRPPRPVNMTALCKISPTVSNRIQVSWSSDYGRCYVISVYLVQKLASEDLLSRLKTKGPRLPDFTKSLIKQKLREDGECEIATTSLRCSLLCPLGKMRMALPCRAETCIHLQCFDASLFLQMNERKPTWTCPVCDKPAIYDTLVIDGYFQEVLQQNASCNEVTLHKDGDWTPLMPKKEKQEPEKKKSEVAVETLIDDSDDSDDDDNKNNSDSAVVEEVRNKRKNADVEIITLSDSDDDAGPPPPKRPAYQSSSSSSSAGGTSGTSSSANNHNDAEPTDNGTSSTNAECTKSNDSWCVGEVDPGKRLIFRKSLSSSSGTANNGVANLAPTPTSSGPPSPQVICLDLDSPPSSPSPPVRSNAVNVTPSMASRSPSPSLTLSSSRDSVTTPTLTQSPPAPAVVGGSIPSQCTTSVRSSSSPVDNSSGSLSSSNFSMLQDPLSTASFLPPLNLSAHSYNPTSAPPTNNPSTYGPLEDFL